jgi:O-antigen/teichoic acid export membrane protein
LIEAPRAALPARVISALGLPPRPGRFTGNVATTLLAQILFLVLSILNSAILVRRLGPSGKGILDLAVLVPQMLGLILGLGLGVANVYFTGTRRFGLSVLTSNSAAFTLIASGAGVVIVAVLYVTGLFGRILPGVPLTVIVVATIGLPAVIGLSYLNGILMGLNRITTANLITVAQGAAVLLMNLLLVVALRVGLVGAVAASITGSGVALLLAGIALLRLGPSFRPRWDPVVAGATVSFGTRAQVGNIMQTLNYRLDAFLVNGYRGTADVGIYGIAVRMAELLWYLPNAVGFVILPKAASATHKELNAFTPRVFWLTLGLTTLGATGIALVGRWFIVAVFSAAFAPAYLPMLWLLPGVVFLGGAKVLSNEMAGRGYPQYNAWNSGIALVLTVVLDITLIPKHGIVGAAIASSVSYTAGLLIAVLFYLRVRRRAHEA